MLREGPNVARCKIISGDFPVALLTSSYILVGGCAYSSRGEGWNYNPKILLSREAYDCWELSYVLGRGRKGSKTSGILCLVALSCILYVRCVKCSQIHL